MKVFSTPLIVFSSPDTSVSAVCFR